MSDSQVFPALGLAERLHRLEPPGPGRLPIVLDTDPYNEIDDQFAITYALLSPERLELKAIYAAPFANARAGGDPQRGMELSCAVAGQVLDRLGLPAAAIPQIYQGASRFATSPADPAGFTGAAVPSAAAAHLIALARGQPDAEPLYVVGIAAITNIASAILLAPDIISKIVLVWLGGHPHTYYDTNEFNLRQDPFAARVVLDCGVPLVLMPCMTVAEQLLLSTADVRARVAGRGAIGTYLADEFLLYAGQHAADARSIWDMAPIAWLLDPALVETALIPTPILGTSPLHADGYAAPHLGRKPAPEAGHRAHCAWSLDPRRHLMREALRVQRDAIMADFFRKLEAHASGAPD